MRYIILAAMLVAFAPAAYAQSNSGNMGNMGNMSGGTGGMSGGTGGMSQSDRSNMQSPGRMASQGGGENCGTPDEPKACPPLPRHPLPYYPPNKQ
jgi:hypothetical protein